MKKLFQTLVITLFFSSCSHIKSGQYIQLSTNDSLDKLSKEFNVPSFRLKEVNRGKNFLPGEWVFIPLKRGLVSAVKRAPTSNSSVFVGDYDFLWPVPASKRVTSSYGRRWGRNHDGIDIAARKGSHIVAANDGVVVYSGNEMGGYGNITVIGHEGGYFSVYAHANRNFTRKGQQVYRGQVIAAVGSTGKSTGNHLHFEIRRESKSLNPKSLLSKR